MTGENQTRNMHLLFVVLAGLMRSVGCSANPSTLMETNSTPTSTVISSIPSTSTETTIAITTLILTSTQTTNDKTQAINTSIETSTNTTPAVSHTTTAATNYSTITTTTTATNTTTVATNNTATSTVATNSTATVATTNNTTSTATTNTTTTAATNITTTSTAATNTTTNSTSIMPTTTPTFPATLSIIHSTTHSNYNPSTSFFLRSTLSRSKGKPISSTVQTSTTKVSSSLGSPVKALSSASVATIVIGFIVLVIFLLSGVYYFKIRRPSYGRLLDDSEHVNFFNPMFDG